MNYAKWIVYFPEGTKEGLTPESILKSKGFEAVGLFQLLDKSIVGKISNNADLSNLENYQIEIITEEQALVLAQSIDSNAKLENSNIIFTPPKL